MRRKDDVEMKGKYKDILIVYNEGMRKPFEIMVGSTDDHNVETHSTVTLEAAKKYIDNFLKKDFKPTDALIIGWGWNADNKAQEVLVTSIDDEGNVWVKHKATGKREKVGKDKVIADNKENRTKLQKMEKNHEQVNILQQENEEIEESLERLVKSE